MKDYLSQEELNDFMLIGSMLDATGRILGMQNRESIIKTTDTIREGWASRNNLTREEHKNLKTAETYLTKFYESVANRLCDRDVEKLSKKLSKFKFRILDDFTLEQIYRSIYKEMELVKIPRVQFQKWCEEIMNGNCNCCTKHHSSCELCKVFEDNLIPETTWNLENCRYAYKIIDKKVV